jgi:N-acetylmuramoyl-L-alanine amidase
MIILSLAAALMFTALSDGASASDEEPAKAASAEAVFVAANFGAAALADESAKTEVEAADDDNAEHDDAAASSEDVELLALLAMAEAEGECEEGKRLVIDTVLNRVDSEHFPDTISGVIYQPRHFSSMWNGRAGRCEVRKDICRLVREEIESRSNGSVIFFSAGRYSKYGVPMFQVGNHYFSSYD